MQELMRQDVSDIDETFTMTCENTATSNYAHDTGWLEKKKTIIAAAISQGAFQTTMALIILEGKPPTKRDNSKLTSQGWSMTITSSIGSKQCVRVGEGQEWLRH